mgnify:CR=1 FL=1
MGLYNNKYLHSYFVLNQNYFDYLYVSFNKKISFSSNNLGINLYLKSFMPSMILKHTLFLSLPLLQSEDT